MTRALFFQGEERIDKLRLAREIHWRILIESRCGTQFHGCICSLFESEGGFDLSLITKELGGESYMPCSWPQRLALMVCGTDRAKFTGCLTKLCSYNMDLDEPAKLATYSVMDTEYFVRDWVLGDESWLGFAKKRKWGVLFLWHFFIFIFHQLILISLFSIGITRFGIEFGK